MGSKKLPVSINIFPTLDYVELVQFDDKTGEIDKISSLPCSFDLTSRQMSDSEQMTQAVRDLYNTSRIPFNTPAILVLPSFFTREIELPAEFTKEELRFALVSEAERFYIFKKNEPQIDWINLDESRLLYSAFAKSEIEKYQQIFQELRIPLISIELGYFSIIRGLVATGAVAEEIENRGRWCLLVISDFSFFAVILEGAQIIKTTDAPLSTGSDDDLGAIQEIQQDFESFTESETFGKLILVNNSNRINTDALLGNLVMQGNVITIDQNALTLRSRGAVDGAFPCSLEAIGGVFYSEFPELPKMRFLLETSEDVVGIMNLRKQAFNWLLIVNGVAFILCLVAWGVLALLIWNKDNERTEISKQVAQLGSIDNPEELNVIERKKYVKKVLDQNVKINNALVKLGSLAQNDVWLEKVNVESPSVEQPLKIVIEGKAITLEQVSQLKNALSEAIDMKDLEVSNAAQATTEDGQSHFTWSIQNAQAGGAEAQQGGPPFGGPPGAMRGPG